MMHSETIVSAIFANMDARERTELYNDNFGNFHCAYIPNYLLIPVNTNLNLSHAKKTLPL